MKALLCLKGSLDIELNSHLIDWLDRLIVQHLVDKESTRNFRSVIF